VRALRRPGILPRAFQFHKFLLNLVYRYTFYRFQQTKVTVRLSDVISSLVEERGLNKDTLKSIICEGILAAYQKKYEGIPLRAAHDEKTDEIAVEVQKEVVSSVQSEVAQISLRKARHINKALEVGDVLWIPFDGKIGRIEVLKAKQVIASRIRAIEALAVYNEFKDKEGTIVHGVIHKCERAGWAIKLQDTSAFLPKSLSIPSEKCVVGFSIRALLKEVLEEPRNENQLILDRASDLFLRRMFELEIPEVFEKLIEIKKIVRSPGYKSKVAVVSHDPNIDPVGTCVGLGGARIKPILKELGGEKIDVVAWTENTESLVASALKPAAVDRVQMVSDTEANVWVAEDQRSLAIGKMGQNIALASRLTGVSISLVQPPERPREEEGN